jgi:hypothetical protein
MGPPTEAMDAQMHPFGREEDAFDHAPPGKENLWFIDEVDGDNAMVMKGDGPAMRVPASVLPTGAQEGRFFDPKSGKVVDTPGNDTEARRKRMVQDSEYDEEYDL